MGGCQKFYFFLKKSYFFAENMFDFVYSVCYTLYMASEKRLTVVKQMLAEKGYKLDRIAGSHHIFVKKGALPFSIPVHKGKVKPYYVRQIEKIE